MNSNKKYHKGYECINQCEINSRLINRELIKVTRENDTEKVKELLNNGANPNFQKKGTPIHMFLSKFVTQNPNL